MSLIKKENWIICLILDLFFPGAFNIILAYGLELNRKDEWYHDYRYWLFGALCLIFPVFIMITIWMIEMMVKLADKLEVPGKEIYTSPYFWILCLIFPIIGWVVFITMFIYIWIWPVVMIERGKGDEIKEC